MGANISAGSPAVLLPAPSPGIRGASCSSEEADSRFRHTLGSPISTASSWGYVIQELGTLSQSLAVGARAGGVSSPGRARGSESGPEGPGAQLQITPLARGLDKGSLQPLSLLSHRALSERRSSGPCCLVSPDCAAVRCPDLPGQAACPLSTRAPFPLLWGAHVLYQRVGLDE